MLSKEWGGVFECDGILFNCQFRISGNGHRIIIGKGTRIYNCTIDISGANNILEIGNSTGIYDSGRIRIEDMNNKVRIGNRVSISSAFFSVADNFTTIEIGDESLISSNVTFRTSDSHSILDALSNKRINHGKDINIGCHCWIGNNATILKGSVIKDNSIIGTHSLVAGSEIPANCCAVGLPARVVKNNVKWIRERI
ncbi:MAG: acyltransferase [Muribaculum sp.]|nr:acyltransferase [Muribaculum sp.]